MLSWLASSSFAILYLHLWMIGHHTDSNGYMALMKITCDMNQFLVVIPVPDESSATLASYSVQHFLLKFDLCNLVVLDDGTRSFIAMC